MLAFCSVIYGESCSVIYGTHVTKSSTLLDLEPWPPRCRVYDSTNYAKATLLTSLRGPLNHPLPASTWSFQMLRLPSKNTILSIFEKGDYRMFRDLADVPWFTEQYGAVLRKSVQAFLFRESRSTCVRWTTEQKWVRWFTEQNSWITEHWFTV